VKALGPRARIVVAWLPATLYTALIWWLSSQTLHVPFIERVPLQDKGVHFLEYGALSWFVTHAVATTWRDRGLRAVAIATLMTTALGLIDELHQAFVPGRASDALDLAADAIGALAGSILYVLLAFVVRTRPSSRSAGADAPELARSSRPPLE
jgi:VanZ family protein